MLKASPKHKCSDCFRLFQSSNCSFLIELLTTESEYITRLQHISLQFSFLQGAITTRLFPVDNDGKVKAIQTTLLQTLLEYYTADEEDVPLDKVCSLYLDLHTHLDSKTVDSLAPAWLRQAQSASHRLHANLVKYGESCVSSAWQSGGEEEVCEIFNACKYVPSELQPALNIAKNGSVLQDLKPVDLPFKELDKELPQLMRAVKKWMCILSFKMELVEKYQVVTSVKQFQESVIQAVTNLPGIAGQGLSNVRPLVDQHLVSIGQSDRVRFDLFLQNLQPSVVSSSCLSHVFVCWHYAFR